MAEDKSADFMAFCALEFQGFFSHIGNAIKQWKATGRLPESAFQDIGPAAGNNAKPKIKRKPTAFNMFVKSKIEELKASGLKLSDDRNNNELFKLAVAEWTQLSDAQRKQVTDSFKVDLEEDVEADGGDINQLPSMNLSGLASPQSPESSKPVPALVSNKRKTDAQSAKADNTAGADSSEQNGDKRPKKKKKKDKKAA